MVAFDNWEEIKEYIDLTPEDKIDWPGVRECVRRLSAEERGKMLDDTKIDQDKVVKEQLERVAVFSDPEYMERLKHKQLARTFKK